MALKSSFPKNIVEAIIFYVSFSEWWCGHIISKQHEVFSLQINSYVT